jgi:hypothetical protein
MRVLIPANSVQIDMPFRPLLESWERQDHRSQVDLRTYRARIRHLTERHLGELEAPLGFGFHVAGRSDLASGCDLDNFLTPVVRGLGGGDHFSIVWATRGSADDHSRLTLAASSQIDLDVRGASEANISLDVSSQRPEWKAAIARAVGKHPTSENSAPIELALTFRVSPKRNWVSLWKPTIDALGGVLGEGARAWHPRDDRIRLLFLRRELVSDRGWEVDLRVLWAEAAIPPSPN